MIVVGLESIVGARTVGDIHSGHNSHFTAAPIVFKNQLCQQTTRLLHIAEHHLVSPNCATALHYNIRRDLYPTRVPSENSKL